MFSMLWVFHFLQIRLNSIISIFWAVSVFFFFYYDRYFNNFPKTNCFEKNHFELKKKRKQKSITRSRTILVYFNEYALKFKISGNIQYYFTSSSNYTNLIWFYKFKISTLSQNQFIKHAIHSQLIDWMNNTPIKIKL